MARPRAQALLDCPMHRLPDLPDQDTAKHAAGYLLSADVVRGGLLPATAVNGAVVMSNRPLWRLPPLTGLIFTQDPPPPRV